MRKLPYFALMVPELNSRFELALQFAHFTSRNIFLTGKAGTGKTTFLKHLRETSPKKMAVLAPTGVAAINAGGMTIHSFFQLPFGPFIPGAFGGWNTDGQQSQNEQTLLKNIKFSSSKIEMIRQLDLLIIDEISMVRADTLDAIDLVLRHFRKKPALPFGGLQMLFIGDLFQLPPVIPQDEWSLLSSIYSSPFFFDSLVCRQEQPVYLELTKIYRQEDEDFIGILNRIRNGKPLRSDLEILNSHYQPDFVPPEGDQYITLTSHNYKAIAINRDALAELPGKSQIFKATVEGDFSERSFPADKELELKEGAQVMFIKNDKGEERRYYNGKIGTITRIRKDSIRVQFPGERDDIEVEKETWKNIRYTFNRGTDKLEEEELGTLTQYPLRLAWAITIHKSQGLTFDKAVIDARESFAAGQVYVALSRMRSMEKMILCSQIQSSCIRTNSEVLIFAANAASDENLKKVLLEEQNNFTLKMLTDNFNFYKLYADINDFEESIGSRKLENKFHIHNWAQAFVASIQAHLEIGNRFMSQLQHLANHEPDRLMERTRAGVEYFLPALQSICTDLKEQMEQFKKKQKNKKFHADLAILKESLERKINQVRQSEVIARGILDKVPADVLLKRIRNASEESFSSGKPISLNQPVS